MFKKILCMFAVVVVLTAVFAVTASAVSYWEEDFSNFNLNTGFSYKADPTGSDFERSIEDGALKIRNGVSGGNVTQALDFTLDCDPADDVIFQYDIKIERMNGTNLLSYICVDGENGRRSTTKITDSYTCYGEGGTGKVTEDIVAGNKWYTYVYHFKKGSGGVINGLDVYRKERDASGQPGLLVSLNEAQISAGNEACKYYTYVTQKTTICFDNIKCYSGNSVKNGRFLLNDVLMADTGDLESGTITAEAEIVLGELPVNTSTGKLKTREVLPYFVAFDSEGKLVYCKLLATNKLKRQLSYGKNLWSFDVETSKFDASAKDGYLGFYILDTSSNYRAFVDPVELTAAE